MKITSVTQAISVSIEFVDEFRRAREHFAPMNSAHEGYAVLLEEVDELWEDIKKDDHKAARKEAVQVGAMVLSLIVEVLDGYGSV